MVVSLGQADRTSKSCCPDPFSGQLRRQPLPSAGPSELHSGFAGVAAVAETPIGAVGRTLAPRRVVFWVVVQVVEFVVELEQLFAAVGVVQIACFAVETIASCDGCQATGCDRNCL